MKHIFIAAATATAIAASAAVFFGLGKEEEETLPLVSIVNYGPLKDLEISIQGIKDELADNGFIENKSVKIEISDIAFDHSLIPQTVTSSKNHNPRVMVVISTPIAQFAKGKIHDIPLVFHAITDPTAAGLLKDKDHADANITGSSDMQNLDVLLEFVKSILPEAKAIGILCLTSDSNDATLLDMMKKAADRFSFSVVAIPVDQVRDIPVRMQEFKGKVDFIYVGASGLHAAMPSIASEASKMNTPVFDSEDQSVRDGLALASFGVNYESVGRNAGKLVAKLLNGAPVKDLSPIFPKLEDHRCFVNKKLAEKFKIKIPGNAIIVE
ncbi:MAG: ABC transporter substrate-binding protein [Holosporaceae bacterium]|jgi:putative ABC transport system substrate-binding protein|nr:ABC transporter substrate-binding protein [Holosporaceae bacterium]